MPSQKLVLVLTASLLIAVTNIEAESIMNPTIKKPVVSFDTLTSIVKAFLTFKYVLYIHHLVRFKKD